MGLNLRKPFTLMISAFMALTAVTAASAASTVAPKKINYEIVALGDSITVGYEHGMTAKSVPYGYADRLYEQALFHGRASYTNYGIMGLTTTGLYQLLQGADQGKTLDADDLQNNFADFAVEVGIQADSVAAKAPEIAVKLETADLVVMTIGGNDFGAFIKKVLEQPTETARQTIADEFDAAMNNYTTNLNTVIRQLQVMAPNAQILFADQYLPLWYSHDLYPDLILAVNKLANHLDGVVEQLAQEGIPVDVVHISPKFNGKEIALTYANTFDYDNHPRQAGYEAIAEAYAEVIWKQYLKPPARSANAPISVIINGNHLSTTPILKNNTTFLAIRDFSNAVSADLEWIEKTKTAIFRKNGLEVSLTIGADKLYVNGIAKKLLTPAYLAVVNKQKKTYVPLAAIADGLDYQVIYRTNLKTAFINQ